MRVNPLAGWFVGWLVLASQAGMVPWIPSILAASSSDEIEDPSAIVKRLGSARFMEREEAANRLESLGRAALTALKSARESRDPEVQARAKALIAKIELNLLTGGTMVRPQFKDAAIQDVVKSLAKESGQALSLFREDDVQWSNRKITLSSAEPITLLDALDRLCVQAKARANNQWLAGTPRGTESGLILFPGPSARFPSSYDGPFRIQLTSIVNHRELSLVINEGNQVTTQPNEQFQATGQISAEPRLSITLASAPILDEAIDDQGHNLLPPNMTRNPGLPTPINPNFNLMNPRNSMGVGLGASQVMFQLPLARPVNPGTRITRLRGSVPLVISAKTSNPLKIRLEEAVGKTFESDGLRIKVVEVKPVPESSDLAVELTVEPSAVGEDDGGLNAASTAWFPNVLQFEAFDAQGRPCQFNSKISNRADALASSSSVNLTIRPSGAPLALNALAPGGKPVELRYHPLKRAVVEAKFEFLDIPMP